MFPNILLQMLLSIKADASGLLAATFLPQNLVVGSYTIQNFSSIYVPASSRKEG